MLFRAGGRTPFDPRSGAIAMSCDPPDPEFEHAFKKISSRPRRMTASLSLLVAVVGAVLVIDARSLAGDAEAGVRLDAAAVHRLTLVRAGVGGLIAGRSAGEVALGRLRAVPEADAERGAGIAH